MGTNPIGKGTSNISVNVSNMLKADIERLAKRSGLTTSAYVRAAAHVATQKELLFKVEETVQMNVKVYTETAAKKKKGR